MENQHSLAELQLKHRAQSLFNGEIVPYSDAVRLLTETHETLSHLSYSDPAFERFLNEFSKLSNYLDALVKVEGIQETKHLKAYQVLIQNEFNEKLTPRFAIFSEFSEMERLESVLNRHGLLNMFRVSELENPGILVFLLNTGAVVKAKTEAKRILNSRSVLPDETPSESSIPYRQKLSDFDRQMNTILDQSEIFADALRKDFLEQISLPEELLFPSPDTQGSDVDD